MVCVLYIQAWLLAAWPSKALQLRLNKRVCEEICIVQDHDMLLPMFHHDVGLQGVAS